MSTIRFENVTFGYHNNSPILENFNLTIKNGKYTVLLGHNGSGKSTLAKLSIGLLETSSGSIYVDDLLLNEENLAKIRNKIAIVFQDNFLFGGTIRDNILLGKEDASGEEIANAVKGACLDEFINTLDKGLDTEIGERGVLLSGGQKQRIAIARAFIKNAPIVILDEATSALDNKSEAIVQQAIENLMADRTVFIIAHRLSTVRNADKIVVVNYGKIAEIGTHEELIDRPNGIYASLYHTQLH